MLRVEARNAETPIERKPEWIRTTAKMGPEYTELQLAGEDRGPAHGVPGGRLPQHLRVLGGPRGDLPHRRRRSAPAAATSARSTPAARRTSTATSRAGSPSRCSRWACATPPITGVARDDLARRRRVALRRDDPPDPRAQPRHRRRDPRARLQRACPSWSARSSTPRPEVFAHNLETVPRIFKRIRPAFRYERSLDGPHHGPRGRAGHQVQPHPRHGRGGRTRSRRPSRDLHEAGCDIITITQYLRPSPRHHPIDRWVKPEEFVHWSERRRRRSASRASWPVRWCARPTAPAGCGPPAMSSWGRPIPEHLVAPRRGRRLPRPPGGGVVGRARA